MITYAGGKVKVQGLSKEAGLSMPVRQPGFDDPQAFYSAPFEIRKRDGVVKRGGKDARRENPTRNGMR
jgi:hypothetical protein